ncbi:hypothetical protein PAPYR_11332 [Paratrimastix pyriformis]|uniref:Uncharacterized protein n=1 Tax=Paratrimastix pyriformis TaxID=342808 RepID=A0ABQ8U3X9_9EUKA|nr:hypothetical protein PAPYR_11332 [Paratrimastix pyriformis]
MASLAEVCSQTGTVLRDIDTIMEGNPSCQACEEALTKLTGHGLLLYKQFCQHFDKTPSSLGDLYLAIQRAATLRSHFSGSRPFPTTCTCPPMTNWQSLADELDRVPPSPTGPVPALSPQPDATTTPPAVEPSPGTPAPESGGESPAPPGAILHKSTVPIPAIVTPTPGPAPLPTDQGQGQVPAHPHSPWVWQARFVKAAEGPLARMVPLLLTRHLHLCATYFLPDPANYPRIVTHDFVLSGSGGMTIIWGPCGQYQWSDTHDFLKGTRVSYGVRLWATHLNEIWRNAVGQGCPKPLVKRMLRELLTEGLVVRPHLPPPGRCSAAWAPGFA